MAYITFQPKDHFNTVLYTGNGSTQSITGVGFQPDMTWGKARSTTTNHVIQSSVQGLSTAVFPNLTNAQSTGLTNGITSFNADGFSLGDWSPLNASSQTFVAWNWKAGNSQGSSNTDGTINTTYTSVNTTAGFSISQYGGNGTQFATVGHGLGVAPNVIMIKNLTGTTGWIVYHDKAGLTGSTLDGEAEYKMLSLNGTGAASDNNNDVIWGSTSTRYKIDASGSATYLNSSGSNYVAYCFAEKKGYSKFGSYTGNGNADGAFVYTGFKPAFIIVKRSSATEDWKMFDNKRPGYNLTDLRLKPNGSETETSSGGFDFTSNGFKARSTDAAENASGSTYIYMAFAEEPLVSSNNIPATAR